MAELDHGLSLADALTEPPPQIEEEVKRDFIATLEAEKFDDVVGEKVGKTDYVPLLDDDDMKAGTQEVKTKPHADQVERASATGPAGVVENGDHGIEGGRKVSPGKIMDDQLSYKEFLDRNDSWQMGERDRCFDSQLAFKPPDMTEPFKMHREDVLSNLLLLPQEMTGMPTFGDYFGAPSEVHVPFGAAGMPEQPPLGPPHSPANVFDPLAFLGEDLGAESLLNQNEAVPANEMGLPEDFFSGTRPLVEAQGAPFFEPPAPGKMPEETELFLPGSVVMGFPDLPGEPKAPEANPFAPAGSAVPDPAEEELVGFEPWFDQRSLPPTEAATTSLEATVAKNQKAKAVESADPAAFGATLEKEEGKKAPLGQHKEKESSSQFFGLQSEEAAMSKSSAKASESQAGKAAEPPPDQEADQEAVWPEAGGRELHALKAEDDKTAPSQQAERVEETQASFGQPAEEAAAQPLGPQADESKPSRAQHAAKAEGGQPSGKQEEDQPPSSPSQSQEHLPALDERSKESPSKPVEKQDEQKQPPTKPVEHFPELEESKEPVPLGQPKAEPQEPFPGTAALEFAGAEKPKEVPEPSCDQPVEQPQEKASPDPEGVSTAQVRQANKSSDHRRFAKSKTSQAPLAESPGELLARFPAQKSRDQGEDLFASPERGYVAGTSPRGKPAARKVVGQLFDLGEGQRDALQESWDLEASAALKKKKKKPKQKRSQHPRPVETWEESSERLGAPVSADEPRKSHAPLAVPLESSQVVTGVSMGVLWKGTSKPEMEQQLLDAQSVSSAPAKGEPIQHPEGSLKLESDAKTVESGRAEVMSDDRALLLSKSRKKGSSKEQVKGPTKLNKPGSPTVSPAQASPAAISIFGEFTAWEGHPPKNLDLDMPALEAKPTVSCSAAVSGEDAKPADVSGKEAVAGRVVLEGKPKHQGGRGKGRGAGEEAAGSPLEGKMLGMPAFEAKTTVSCSAAVSGEDAKPADVSGKEAVAGRVVLEGKPKHQGGRGKGRGAGEEAAGSPLEGKMLGMPAFEAKPTVSCSAAVSGEDAKPADVSGKEAVAGRVVLEGKLKQQGGRGRGGRAGEEAAGFPLEGKMLGMPAFEAKPTVSCSTAVSGEDAKPADVSGKEAVAGRVVLEGKPKQQGGRGRGGRAGEEAAGSPLEGKMLGMPALEAKPTVSCSTAVSGEDAKPSDVSGKEAVAGRVVLEGKLKQQGGLRRGGRAGEEAAGFPLEGMMLEASKERAFPGQSSPVVSELAPLAAAGASPDDRNVSSPRKSEKTAFGSGEGAFSREACPDTAKPPVPREDLVGGGTIPLADTNEAVCSSPSEKPAVAVLQVEAGQPHKRSSSGESRKVEDSLGQQPLPSEVASDSRQGLAADEVAVPPKTDPGAPSQEVSLSGLAESKAAHGPAGTGERPKKRSSDRKSRKAAERSSFAPSFFLEEEKIAGGLPADQVKEKAVSSRETASEAANQSLEVAADPAKSDARSALPQVGKPNVPPPSKGEWADFPSSAYPFIMETPAKTPGADAQTEGIAVPYQGKGFGSSSLEGSVTVEPGSIALTSKPKKRTSDGRSKKSGKPAAEHPEPSAGVNRPRKAGSTKGTDAVDQGNSTPLEQPGGSRGPFPALKLMEGPEGKKDEDSIAAAGRNSFSEHLPASAHKTSPVQPEPLAKIKDASSTRKGQEVSLAALEQLAEAVTTPREPEGPEYAGQSPQLHGLLEAKPDAAGPAAACKEVGQTEKGPSPAKGKGRAAGSLVRDAAAAGQVSDEPLVDETIKGVPEGMTGKISSGVNPLFPLGFGAEQVLGAETCEKPKGHSSDRRRKEGRDGSSELASRQDLSAKPAKRGSDGKSKKATGSPEQPVLAPPKPEPSRGQRPQGAELNYALEETEFVDENRNIKRFPPGHPMLWDENTMSLFGPFGPPGPAALEEAGSKSQCPFLKYQGKAAADLRKEQLPPPETPRGPSGGGWADTPGLPEDSAAGEIREAMIEASLLVTAGDKTRERRKKTRQAALDRAAKGDAKAEEDRVLSSVLAEAGGGGVNLSEKIPSFGLSSSELAVTEEKTAALTTGAGAEGREAVVPSAELPAPWEDSKEVVALQALTTALVGGPGEPVGSNEGTEVDKQRASECPESLGSKAGVDKASEDVPATEAASANKPQGSSEPPEQGAANEPVVYQPVLPAGQEEPTRKAAEQMNAQGPVSETGQSVAGGLQTAAERPDQAARETKREERARPVEQIKGYMRPTKSRGLPPPPLRAAAPEPGKRRPAKADGPGPHRQERAKPEELKAASEVVTANNIAAPPSKELPPSPEKKTKPSASAPAKPAAAKTKPVSAAAAPAKRPASTTPGQNKKATSPTAGPAAATTPKRPATSATRPSTLTPKDSKPKGTDAKSAEKRTSPSKAPSAATPRSSVKSSPAASRPSTALTSTNAAAGPRNSATSPPKRPSTAKTDSKPTDTKKTMAKSPSADLSRPKSAPASAKPSATTPTTASPGLPGAAANRPKPTAPRLSGTAGTTANDSKKASTLKAAPKAAPVSKPPRPPTSVSAPDLKNIRSKIGSTDNIKHQPGGGKAKVERKAESAGAARKPEFNAVSKTAVTKEGAPKQPNGKVQIVSKKASYSHVQSKCGSKDNIKHVPGGGNVPNAQRPASGLHSQSSTGPKPSKGSTHVQILNKKIDLSKVSSKCGSKTNIKHKPGGGDVKIENQKLNFKEKAQAKVGSLDNVGHVPAGGAVKTEGGQEAAPQNGAVPAPLPGSSAAQENGVGQAAPAQGGGDQMEILSFDTHIQETSI